VSNAVNRPGCVSATSLRRVQAAIEELGFVRNEAARQLRRGKSRTVGFVMLDGKNPFFMEIVRAAQDRLADVGLVMTLGDSARDVQRERGYLDLFEELRVQGILISPYGNVDERLQQLDSRGIGAVLLNRQSSDGRLSSVSGDEVAGGRLAVEHLVARGRRRIAFVGSEDASHVAKRLIGVRQVIAMNPGRGGLGGSVRRKGSPVVARCNPQNRSSWRLLERLGFRSDGDQVRSASFASNDAGEPKWHDTYLYATLADEWSPPRIR